MGTSQTERKEWMYQQAESRTACDKEPSEEGTHTDIRNTTEQFQKPTHTSDTRESLPARRNYLDLSISVSRTIRIPSHSHSSLPRFLSLLHSIHSWLCIWMDSDCFLPSYSAESAAFGGWSRRQLHATRAECSRTSRFDKERNDWVHLLPCRICYCIDGVLSR